MSQTLSSAAEGLHRAGEMLGSAAARLGTFDPGARAFGADGPGGLGELGRVLHHQWQRALDARAREAAAHGARLDDAGETVARAAGGYGDIDDAARRHQPEVS
jgi:hypothetical protein